MEGARVVCRVDDEDDAQKILDCRTETIEEVISQMLLVPGVVSAVLAAIKDDVEIHRITDTEDPTLKDVAISYLLSRCG